MTGNSDYQPEGIIRYGVTGLGQVLFLIERNDRTNEDGSTRESWDFNYAEVAGFDSETIINAVIREKYSQSQVEAIFANHLAGTDTGQYAAFQQWREMAKAVASGKYLKKELEGFLVAPAGDVLTDIVTVLNEKGLVP